MRKLSMARACTSVALAREWISLALKCDWADLAWQSHWALCHFEDSRCTEEESHEMADLADEARMLRQRAERLTVRARRLLIAPADVEYLLTRSPSFEEHAGTLHAQAEPMRLADAITRDAVQLEQLIQREADALRKQRPLRRRGQRASAEEIDKAVSVIRAFWKAAPERLTGARAAVISIALKVEPPTPDYESRRVVWHQRLSNRKID